MLVVTGGGDAGRSTWAEERAGICLLWQKLVGRHPVGVKPIYAIGLVGTDEVVP